MREFSSNSNVVFGDVNLQDAGDIPGKFGAGQGGWPTVRYFNAQTGYDGAPYTKKTDKSMCDELGDMEYGHPLILYPKSVLIVRFAGTCAPM